MSSRTALLVLTFVLVTAPAWCQETIDFPQNQGVDVGDGFDVVSSLKRMSPFVATKAKQLTTGGGQNVHQSFEVAETSERLEEVMNVSASGRYGAGFFNVSAKTDFTMSKNNDRYALNAIATSVVVNRETVLDGMPELGSSAKALLARENGLELFHRAHGDRFVYSISTGGEYYGIYTLRTSSDEDSMALAVSLKASNGLWSAKGSFEKAVKSVSTSRIENRQSIMIGGKGIPAPSTMEEMARLSETWAAQVADTDRAVPIKMYLQSYDVFPEYVEAVERATAIATMSDVMMDLGYNFYDFTVMANTVAYILANPDDFRFKDDRHRKLTLQELTSKKREMDKILAQMKAKRTEMANGTLQPAAYADLGLPTAEAFGASLFVPVRYRAKAGTVQVQLPNPQNIVPRHVPAGEQTRKLFDGSTYVRAGDCDMKGHKPRIRIVVDAVTSRDGSTLRASYHVTMQESTSDWTTFDVSGFGPELPAPKGLRFGRVVGGSGKLEKQEGKSRHGLYTYPGTGCIARAVDVRSDSKGADGNSVRVGMIELRPVTVTYVHEEDARREPFYMEQYWTPPQGLAAPKAYGGTDCRAPLVARRPMAVSIESPSAQAPGEQADETGTSQPRSTRRGSRRGFGRLLSVFKGKKRD